MQFLVLIGSLLLSLSSSTFAMEVVAGNPDRIYKGQNSSGDCYVQMYFHNGDLRFRFYGMLKSAHGLFTAFTPYTEHHHNDMKRYNGDLTPNQVKERVRVSLTQISDDTLYYSSGNIYGESSGPASRYKTVELKGSFEEPTQIILTDETYLFGIPDSSEIKSCADLRALTLDEALEFLEKVGEE